MRQWIQLHPVQLLKVETIKQVKNGLNDEEKKNNTETVTGNWKFDKRRHGFCNATKMFCGTMKL